MTDSVETPAPPSTARFFWIVVGKAIGFVIAWAILNPILFHGRETLGWAAGVGSSLGFLEAALLYRKAEWRKAVAPEHVFGFGALGLSLIAMGVLKIQRAALRPEWWSVVCVALFVSVPAFLLVRSGVELWQRRGTLPE